MNCNCIIEKMNKETINAWLPLITSVVIAVAGIVGVLIQVSTTRKNKSRENIELAFSDLLMHLYIFQRGGFTTYNESRVNIETFLSAIGKCQVSLKGNKNNMTELKKILANIFKDYVYAGDQSKFPEYIEK